MVNVFLPEKDVRAVREIASKAGFKNEEEFIQKAVEEKILEFKKLLFADITIEIRKGLEKKEVSQDDLLQDFEKFRRE